MSKIAVRNMRREQFFDMWSEFVCRGCKRERGRYNFESRMMVVCICSKLCSN
jgi:hypothetical protein